MKTASQYFQGIKSRYCDEVVECSLRGEYAVMVCKGEDPHGMRKLIPTAPISYRYDVIVINRATCEIDADKSDTIYLSYRSAMEFVESLGPIEHTSRTRKPAQPQTAVSAIIATYAKVIYEVGRVHVRIEHDAGISRIPFKPRKSWSHRRYVDNAMQQAGMKPSADFRYGWDMTAI